MNDIEKNKEELQKFLLDTDTFRELEKWTNNFNLFRILSIEHMEIKHSNILAWLLDPNGSHNLGDLFLSEFLKLLAQYDEKPFDLLLIDPYTFSVYREENRMDILLISQERKTIIVIENKIYADETSNQLERYKNFIENKYPKYKKIFVFLTPDEKDASEEYWLPIGYQNISNILENTLQVCEKDLTKEVNILLSNYLDVLRRDVMENSELVALCNKIYKKHKKAIDLIVNYKTDPIKEWLHDEIIKKLKELENEGKIIFDEKATSPSYLVFYTEKMNKLLQDGLSAGQKSSWNDSKCYRYWFHIQKKRNKKDEEYFYIHGCLEFGGNNVKEETLNLMQEIRSFSINKKWCQKVKRNKIDKYARTISIKKQKINSHDDDTPLEDQDKCRNYISKTVADLLSKETEIINKFGK